MLRGLRQTNRAATAARLRAGGSLQHRFEFGLRGWISGCAFKDDVDRAHGPAFVIADLSFRGGTEKKQSDGDAKGDLATRRLKSRMA